MLLLIVSTDPILYFGKLTEECITQRHGLDTLHVQIIQQIRVQVKEHRHIHRLAGIQSLLLETETLNLAKVWCTLGRRYTVCCHANDVGVALVGGRVEGQCRLAGENADFALLRNKLPGENVGYGGIEGDSDTLGIFDGDEAA